ncbi:acyl-CoA dehydrogenase [Portibacter lacus]|uniref:Acyl-CoA dehydrogenase n=1 Tax=Portibacter lacus TaxID=1099794 RepID=A0AA37SSK6_9BACT|nr:acyl-CoA dehydrogenase [Portibacter lacus]GLR18754.1 acyl-CoA dehydrogenase [Portibacter lacus]
MATFINTDTLKFQLFDVLNAEQLLESEYFGDHDKEGLGMFLDSITDFSEKELFPYFQEMDENPAHFKNGKIITHPQVAKMFSEAADLGVIAATLSNDHGGLQIPLSVHTVATAIMDAANNSMPGYAGLTLGSLELILEFGSDDLIQKYAEHMMTGQYAGTMCLTEPQAGSSLSDITTSATPQEDGTYLIKGQKIFISGGDHEHTENVIHLLLARIDGAPAGTKGISLFTVPKFSPDGSSNDVITAGEFLKMGQKGYCTTHLIFGEKDHCVGELVGETNQGLKQMFKMMNGARIAVGRGAAAIAMAAYEASLKYANERSQGRKVTDTGKKDPSQEQTLIINHPDVRRLMLRQKAISEGAMSLVLQSAYYHDRITASNDPEEKKKYHLLLELLTPMAKTYPSEKGIDAVSDGLQVLGGYGFCSEYILQQYYRDIRIFTLYEGTTGIQSIDLLGRKMTMNEGKAPQLLAQEISKTLSVARKIDDFAPYADQLGRRLKDIVDIMEYLGQFSSKGKFNTYLADASLFMEYFSTVVVAWQWLKMGIKATEMKGSGVYSDEFLESKIHTMKFFFHYEVKATAGLKDIIMDPAMLTLKTEKEVII